MSWYFLISIRCQPNLLLINKRKCLKSRLQFIVWHFYRPGVLQAWSNNTVCLCVCSVAQSCPSLCDFMDWSPPGSSVLGIFLARILELVAISYPRGSSQPRGPTCVSYVSCIGMWSLSQGHLGIPESIQSNNIVKSTNPFKLLDFLHSTILDFKILKKNVIPTWPPLSENKIIY